MTIIFYILVIFSAIVYLVLLYNLREKLKVHDVRAKIARDLHDEIGANISGIGMSISMIQKNISKFGAQALPTIIADLDKVKLDINTTVEMLREEDWIIKPENDSLHKLLDKIKVFGHKILNACEITFEYDNSLLPDKEVIISMIQRRSAFLICKEAINNIGKHSKAKKAWMKVSKAIEGIKIEIGDNGCGFDMEDERAGNGVNNFRARAAESLIGFDMKSNPGKGTVIIITIPELYTQIWGRVR
ncbi:MAG: hypothetical protein HC905_32315 [Bacteroidales bacterium]|nr:hypothetical protein [Bacteroidales bacterium]